MQHPRLNPGEISNCGIARNANPLRMVCAMLIVVPLIAGCFHKNVMTDTADDIKNNLLYQGPEGNFIISKEEIFQANSKSTEGGVTNISGYSEMRLSSYRIATGELAGRVELGDMIEESNALLGYSPGKIWMYSILPELGLHYRDPITLEVKESWTELSQKPGWNTYKPAHPDWPLIDQYFAYDWVNQRLLLTDEAGFRFAVDPSKLDIQKVEAELPRLEWTASILNTSGEFQEDDRINFEGDPRKSPTYMGKKSKPEVSFLFGQWIFDNNPDLAGKRKREKLASLNLAIKTAKDSLANYSSLHPEAELSPNWSTWTEEQRELKRRSEDWKRAIDDMNRELTSAGRIYEQVLDYPLLTPDGRRAYILHANMVADTAHSIVSEVVLADDSTWVNGWTTHLQGIYHDYSKADQAGAFETVYSKGNPSFNYMWSGTDGHYLVLIAQLQMLCLDLETGELLWNIKI